MPATPVNYVRMSRPVKGYILNLKIKNGSIIGNALDVSEQLNASFIIPADKSEKPYITGQTENDSFIARDGDLILINNNNNVMEVVRAIDIKSSGWVVNPLESNSDTKNDN